MNFNNRMQTIVLKDNYINLLEFIAGPNNAIPLYTEERKFISSDGYHLTYEGS